MNQKYIIGLLLIFSFIFVFFGSKCSPLYFFNEWCDPNIYFSMGKALFNGKVLYKDVFDHKGPLIFFIYGIGYLISNADFTGVYFIESILLFINLLFAYKLASLYLKKEFAFIVSLIYAVLLFTRSGTGGSADEFISPFMLISFYYFISFFREGNLGNLKKQFFIHGVMFSIVFFIKYSACVFWGPLVLAIIYKLLKDKQYNNIFIYSFSFLCGFMIVATPIMLYFILNSAVTDFFFGYFKFNTLYVSVSLGFRLDAFMNIAARFVKKLIVPDFTFWLVLLGLGITLISNKYTNDVIYKAGLFFSFLFTYMLIASSPDNMGYAYIVLFIYAIITFIILFGKLPQYIRIKTDTILFYLISFLIVLSLGIYSKKLFDMDSDSLLRKREYPYMQKEFAKVINMEANPTLLNLGLDRGVFTAADIVPSYKYFFHPYILDEVFPNIKNYQDSLIRLRKPLFIVTGNTGYNYLQENYRMVESYQDEDGISYLFRRKE